MAVATLPIAEPGMRIGLFGGSFNPAHEGHRLVALECLKRLALDKVWLLVSPGNPLKSRSELAPLDERLTETVKIMDDPRLEVTGFEEGHGFGYTWETLRFLTSSHPQVKFVWIMGADSLQSFDQWERWRDIAAMVPIAVYARPGSTFRATSSPAATALAADRIPEDKAPVLADSAPPVWVYLRGVMSSASSTAIRQARAKSTSIAG